MFNTFWKKKGLTFPQHVSLLHYSMSLHYVIHPMGFSLLEKGWQNDCYCWVGHRENIVLCCMAYPRAYHQKCAGEVSEFSDWVCPECQKILTAENVDTRSSVSAEMPLHKLCTLLRFCLNKMRHRTGVALHQHMSLEHYPMYLHYIIHPMGFSLLEKNIKQKPYGCTEAFLSDVKWIMLNSCVFNGSLHPFSSNAKTLVKTCENDMQEIEAYTALLMFIGNHTCLG